MVEAGGQAVEVRVPIACRKEKGLRASTHREVGVGDRIAEVPASMGRPCREEFFLGGLDPLMNRSRIGLDDLQPAGADGVFEWVHEAGFSRLERTIFPKFFRGTHNINASTMPELLVQ